MKPFLFLALIFLLSKEVKSQTSSIMAKAGAEEMYAVPSNEHTNLKVRGMGSFFLTVYQKFISSALSGDCLYHPSCSRYSRDIIAAKGIIPGILATGDRLTRCSGLSALEIPDFRFNPDGYVIDLPE